MRIIAVINQKGGVGKTVTAVNMGACLALHNRRVLIVDFDPQANSSLLLGRNTSLDEPSVYDVMAGNINPEEIIEETSTKNLFLMPSNLNLAEAEIDIVERPGREIILAEQLISSIDRGSVIAGFDYIIIDCSPSLSILTVNALMAAREIFIPMQMTYFALKGADHLINIVELVNEELEHPVSITGVIPTFFEKDPGDYEKVLEEVKELFGGAVFETVIHRSTAYDKAAAAQKTVFEIMPESDASWDYRNLTQEVIKMEQEEEGDRGEKKGFLSSLFKKTY